jgi:hypothetical protein
MIQNISSIELHEDRLSKCQLYTAYKKECSVMTIFLQLNSSVLAKLSISFQVGDSGLASRKQKSIQAEKKT